LEISLSKLSLSGDNQQFAQDKILIAQRVVRLTPPAIPAKRIRIPVR